jgi:hypothetical protein
LLKFLRRSCRELVRFQPGCFLKKYSYFRKPSQMGPPLANKFLGMCTIQGS